MQQRLSIYSAHLRETMAEKRDLSKFELVVHATDEAGIKIGGPGAVLDGILSSGCYLLGVQRTVLVGPMNTQDDVTMERLVSAGNKLTVEYSSYHGLDKLDRRLSAAVGKLEASYNVHILYGRREFDGSQHDVILVDATRVVPDKLNFFKRRLYERFGLQSDRYETDPEYSLCINAAEPSYLALKTFLGNNRSGERFMVAHNYSGLPLLYSAVLRDPGLYHSVFFAHEVATMRSIVENSFGHDTMFYNTLRRARAQGLFLGDVFGDQSANFRHALLKTATQCDNILAVGDSIIEELRFVSPVLAQAHIDLVYNGLSTAEITLEEKMASHTRLGQYAVSLGLFDKPPDFIFTHVTRFVPSKALWRDVRVLEHLDQLLAAKKKRAVLYVLASALPGGRRVRDVYEWEEEYGWPVVHRDNNGDLQGGEIPFYQLIETFNARAQATRIVLVNQFGWNRERCGARMPEDMVDSDIRWGSTLEFGQSIYEPFGISQTEPLSYGALCVVSSVCGCLGFIRQVSQGKLPKDIILADYVTLPEHMDIDDHRATQVLGQSERDLIEESQALQVAQETMARLPTTKRARQALLRRGHKLSQKMSWDTVVQHYLLPALVRAASKQDSAR
jgi:hypothetical protein